MRLYTAPGRFKKLSRSGFKKLRVGKGGNSLGS